MSVRTDPSLLPRIRPTLALILVLGFAGCGGDPTAPAESLSEEERALVARALLLVGLSPPSGDVPAAARHPSLAPTPIDQDLSCPADGSVRAEGTSTTTVDEVTGTIRVEAHLSLDHRGCSVRSTDDAAAVTVDTASGVDLRYLIVVDEGLFEVDGSVAGTVRYQVADRSGSCAADLEWSGAGGIEGGNTYEVVGNLCGTPIRTTIRDD